MKLKQAKKNLTDFFSISSNVPCYQETDIIWALQYIVDTARRSNRQLAVCIALGTSQGAHDNSGALNTVVSVAADFPGVAVLTTAGNEGNSGRHFFGTVKPSVPPATVEVNVAENEYGFTMEFWGNPPTIYTLDILSPAGEYVPAIAESIRQTRRINFVFEQTVINIDFFLIEEETGKEVILLRFNKPSPGVWRFKVYAKGDLEGEYHIWLPVGDFISRDTYFVQSNPYTTITSPGNCIIPITITAYNSNVNALYQKAGRGYSTSSIINPDLAAPGVNIQCPALDHSFKTITGSSAATAHAAGIAAMIMEWSIAAGNLPELDTIGIKKFLIRGAKRNNTMLYPNRDWGYGILDIYNSFNTLRTDISK